MGRATLVPLVHVPYQISILPFDTLGLVLGSGAVSRLKILRIIRLMRLLKLVSILKSSRYVLVRAPVCGRNRKLESVCCACLGRLA